MITQARSKRHMPMTSVPLTLLPVSTTDDRETARRLIGEYLNWISDIAGQQYCLSFDIDAMLRSDLNDATKFYPPHGRFYIVQSRDGAIGVGALKRLAVEVGEIQRMYVQPSARGLGAGRLLVQRLLDDARALGLRRVRLESLKALAAACKLYRSVGFVEIAPYADSSMQDYLSHTALQRYRASVVFMEIELSSEGRGASAPGAGEPQHHRRHGAAGLKHRNPLTQEVIMIKEAIVSPKLAPPAGPFSAAIRSGGFVYLSGQIGQDPASGKLIEGGIEKQTEQIFSNLAAVLEAAGKSFNDVVRAGVYLTNMGDFSAMNAIYAKHFEKPFPARTTIGVAALPLGAAVEIDLVVKD